MWESWILKKVLSLIKTDCSDQKEEPPRRQIEKKFFDNLVVRWSWRFHSYHCSSASTEIGNESPKMSQLTRDYGMI
jgi:hypothetical protein